MRRGVGALVGYGYGQGMAAERRLGFRLGLLCRQHQRKEHSSKSDWSSRESSLFGETLGGDLGRLGYGEIRVAEEGRAGIAVAVGVWE